MYVYVCLCVPVWMYTVCMQSLVEVGREDQSFYRCSCGLGTESGDPGRDTTALNQWTFSPVPSFGVSFILAKKVSFHVIVVHICTSLRTIYEILTWTATVSTASQNPIAFSRRRLTNRKRSCPHSCVITIALIKKVGSGLFWLIFINLRQAWAIWEEGNSLIKFLD